MKRDRRLGEVIEKIKGRLKFIGDPKELPPGTYEAKSSVRKKCCVKEAYEPCWKKAGNCTALRPDH